MHQYPVGADVWVLGSRLPCEVVGHTADGDYIVNEGNVYDGNYELVASASEIVLADPADDELPAALRVRIQIGTGATIRQRCLACRGETWKNPVQAFCYIAAVDYPIGAICESCLQGVEVAIRRCVPVVGEIPTYAALERARAIFDF